ncbi:hypothetical protein J2125_002540 [Erwinia toletana]|uniref:Transposase n=1 Tax=Winslowiella toletana TaxID=92490 RepID=A0ABS4PBQ6_9GAMM|nr:hypothetical protein [Winslowiella toletana]MBP2169348.1 hypothetical protein [Winslowiella toletana]
MGFSEMQNKTVVWFDNLHWINALSYQAKLIFTLAINVIKRGMRFCYKIWFFCWRKIFSFLAEMHIAGAYA